MLLRLLLAPESDDTSKSSNRTIKELPFQFLSSTNRAI